MDSSNKKMAGAVIIVLIIVLLFSWQYIGQGEEESSPMEGEWILADSEIMTTSSAPTGSDGNEADKKVNVVRNGGIVTMSDSEASLTFALVSDYEAIAVDYGYNAQLHLSGGTLYLVLFNQVEVDGTSVVATIVSAFTRDGSYDPDMDDFNLEDTAQGTTADVYNANNVKTGLELVSFEIDTERGRIVSMIVSIDGEERKALGFIKGDEDRYTIFCITVDGIVFNLTFEDGFLLSFTGVDGGYETKYYVFDSAGRLKDDVYGLGQGTVIHYRDGTDVSFDTYYDGGRLCCNSDGTEYLFAVSAEGIDGGAFALTPADSALVKVDGKLWMLNSGLFA